MRHVSVRAHIHPQTPCTDTRVCGGEAVRQGSERVLNGGVQVIASSSRSGLADEDSGEEVVKAGICDHVPSHLVGRDHVGFRTDVGAVVGNLIVPHLFIRSVYLGV
jgi:hypothetical protein